MHPSAPYLSSSGRISQEMGFDRTALTIMAFALLNLNGLSLMITGQNSLLSPVILPLLGLVLLRYASTVRFSDLHQLLSMFFLSYLVLGFLSNPFAINASRSLQTYVVSYLLILAISFWLLAVTERDVGQAIRIFRYLCLISSSFTVVFAVIGIHGSYYSETDRYSGFFENPDEAAMVALYGLVAVLAQPERSRLLQIFQLSILMTALALTFSKSGILIAGTITVFFALRSQSLTIVGAVVTVWVFGLAALWWLYDSSLLTVTQRERVAELFGFLSGEVSPSTTTGRTYVLDIGIERISRAFPAGQGLGEFHFLEGGFRNPAGDWLGIHNTYLMVLGEGGLVPLILLLLFATRLIYLGSHEKRYGGLVFGLCIVLFGNMTTVHHALALRFHDVALGFMVALALRARLPIGGGASCDLCRGLER